MSDRRRYDVNRAMKREWQGHHVRDALKRLHDQQRHVAWPKVTTPSQAPQHAQHKEP